MNMQQIDYARKHAFAGTYHLCATFLSFAIEAGDKVYILSVRTVQKIPMKAFRFRDFTKFVAI